MFLQGRVEFQSGYHAPILRDVRAEIQRRKDHEGGESLTALAGGLSQMDACCLYRRQKMGVWLLVASSSLNITDLGAQEWRDSIFLQYGIKTPDLPQHCNGCGVWFSILYALYCRKVSLVMSSHNDLCDGVMYLSNKELIPSYMCNNPLINPGRSVLSKRSPLAGSHPKNNPPGMASE